MNEVLKISKNNTTFKVGINNKIMSGKKIFFYILIKSKIGKLKHS